MRNTYTVAMTVCETHTFMIVDVCVLHMDVETATPDEALEALEDRNPEILETFEDGGRAVKFRRGGRNTPYSDELPGRCYYVPPETPDGLHDWIEQQGSYRYDERERRAVIHGRLNEQTGYLSNGRSIPLAIALDGQKAIAAYLYAVRRWEYDAIASHMDRAESTVRQYISDYKAGRTG